jgi:hypothetical protein
MSEQSIMSRPSGITGPAVASGVTSLVMPAAGIIFLATDAARAWVHEPMIGVVAVAWLLFWCPVFFMSFPALMTQRARDAALAGLQSPLASVWRAVILVPHLILSPSSGARGVTLASVIGFAAGCAAALPFWI